MPFRLKADHLKSTRCGRAGFVRERLCPGLHYVRVTDCTRRSVFPKPAWPPQLCSRGGRVSDFGSFGQSERVFNVHAEVAYRTFDFGMPEQNLHGTQISGSLVDQRRLCTT